MDLLVMCIGNRNGGDDAVGPYIADQLKEENVDFEIIDCDTTPENYTGEVKRLKPKKLLIIDAVEMGLEPGQIRIVPKDKIGVMHISTHGIPVSVLIGYLQQYIDKVIFIGIQPMKMSGKISDIVKKSGDVLIKLILQKKIQNIGKL